MKNLFALLTFALFTLNVQADSQQSEPSYYEVKFEITDISPMCPSTVPSGAMCMAYGQLVTVAAPLNGCLDKVVLSKFKQIKKNDILTIYAVGVAYADPRSILARCYRQNIHSETIVVNDMIKNIQLINTSINY